MAAEQAKSVFPDPAGPTPKTNDTLGFRKWVAYWIWLGDLGMYLGWMVCFDFMVMESVRM